MKYISKIKTKLFKKNLDNDVFKNMLILAKGTAFAQLIGFAVMPFLTRLYTPDQFGILAIFMATVGMIVPFGTLRYSVPVPLPRQDGTAINLLFIALIISLIVASVTAVIFGIYTETIFDFFSISSLIAYWWLIPIVVFGNSLREILISWATRKKEFKSIARTNVNQTLSSSVVKLSLGVLGLKSFGLLIGTIVANIFATTLLFISHYKNLKMNVKHIRIERLKFLLARYIEYPKYRLPSQFILVFSQQIPLLFLAAFFGTDVVGYFGLTSLAISVPFALFGATTGQAYYAEVAKIGRKNPEKIYEVTKDVTKKLFLFSIVPFLVLLIASPWLFSLVFGENWYEAGVYTSILSFYMLAAFVSAPLANALNVFEDQWLFLKLNIIRLIVLVTLFFISWLIGLNAVETITFYSVSMSLYFIYMSYFIFKTIKSQIKD